MNLPTVSVSLVSNNKDFLVPCVKSLLDVTKQVNLEILVVDNLSKEELEPYMHQISPSISVIRNTSLNGYGANHNQNLKVSSGKYFLVLNDDLIFLEDTVSAFIELLEKNKEIAIVGPKLISSIEGGKIQPNNHRWLPTPWRLFQHLLVRSSGIQHSFPNCKWAKVNASPFSEDQGTSVYTPMVVGACFVIRGELMRELGGFDENFFFYSEETDLCKRAIESGYSCYYLAETKVVHLGAQTVRKSWKSKRMRLKSLAIYFKKHFGIAGLLFYLITPLLLIPSVALLLIPALLGRAIKLIGFGGQS